MALFIRKNLKFISPIDKMLGLINRKLTVSQRKELEKHEAINEKMQVSNK